MKPLLPSIRTCRSEVISSPARHGSSLCQLTRNFMLCSVLTTLASAAMAQTGAGATSFATDNGRKLASGIIFVPNNGPDVTIIGGNKTIADTDGVEGELVTFAGTATDSGGTIVSTQWLIDSVVVATGTSAAIVLNDGTTVVSFKATDDDGASSTKAVTYTVQAPAFSLPRIRGISSLQVTSNSEFSIAVRDPNNFLVNIAPVTRTLSMTGYIFPQNADRNFMADIFVVAVTPIGSFMRNLDGAFVPWNGSIANVEPAYENQRLTEQVPVTIFTGKLPFPGTYRLYVGYMRVDRNELIYTANASVVDILP